MPKKQENGFSISRCCCILCTLSFMIVFGVVLIWFFAFFTQDDPEPVASCGDCHCVISGNETCPVSAPRTNFTREELDTWNSLELLNPYRLGCNPYGNEDDCETIPAQDSVLLENDESVCAIHFEESTASSVENIDMNNNTTNGDETFDSSFFCKNSNYKLQTYESLQDAQHAGGFVTHRGHCGVCSSLQDLAAYVQYPDLTSQGKFCAEQGASFSFEIGRDCYRGLGLTDSCAAIWAHSSWNTAKECFLECLVENEQQHQDRPNNGPAPECRLNDCLHCDEAASGALFQRIAGRTQSRSGLVSSIARPCGQLAHEIQHEACPETSPLGD